MIIINHVQIAQTTIAIIIILIGVLIIILLISVQDLPDKPQCHARMTVTRIRSEYKESVTTVNVLDIIAIRATNIELK